MFRKKTYRQSQKMPFSFSIVGEGKVLVSPASLNTQIPDFEIYPLEDQIDIQVRNHFVKFYTEIGIGEVYKTILSDENLSRAFPLATQDEEIISRDGGILTFNEAQNKVYIECPVAFTKVIPNNKEGYIETITYGKPSFYDLDGKSVELVNDENLKDFLSLKVAAEYPAPSPPEILRIEDGGSFKREIYMYKIIIKLGQVLGQKFDFGKILFFNGMFEDAGDYFDFSGITG